MSVISHLISWFLCDIIDDIIYVIAEPRRRKPASLTYDNEACLCYTDIFCMISNIMLCLCHKLNYDIIIYNPLYFTFNMIS